MLTILNFTTSLSDGSSTGNTAVLREKVDVIYLADFTIAGELGRTSVGSLHSLTFERRRRTVPCKK
jgi:hypothetical protein